MKKNLSPYLLITLSFIALILVGALLLSLPFTYVDGFKLNFLDAFFLSTSAVTITGISPVINLSQVLSPFGIIVLTVLTKLGGLSIITVSIFILYLIGAKIGISNRFLLKENLNTLNVKGVISLVKLIVFLSFFIEIIGTILNLFVFIRLFSFPKALAFSLIQAISAFNNSGLDIVGQNYLLTNHTYLLLSINTMLLVIIGGLGFIVIFDLLNKKRFSKLSLHSKIVLKVNLFLWILGFLIFKINSNMTWFDSLFLSVNARSAGFNVNLGVLPNHAILVLLTLMLIGASPTSTGSGIKTTTAYVLYNHLRSFTVGHEVSVNKRVINNESKARAYTLLIFIVLIIILGVTLLLILENISFTDALFDVIGSVSNSGINISPVTNFKVLTKLLLIVLMFIGRIGILTVLGLFNKNWSKPKVSQVEYIEEKVIVG